jgi:putative ABC transport system permease protein
MLRNYLIIAYRNLYHNRIYTLINVFGLAIGLTAASYIFQYIHFEQSYDKFHENADRIYRFVQQLTISGIEEPPEQNSISMIPPILKQELPEVIDYARLFKDYKDNFVVSYDPGDGSDPVEYLEDKVYYADASFMKIFSFPVVLGDINTMQDPNTIILSEMMARKLFGVDWKEESPIGKIITLNDNEVFTVTGIFKDLPENSHIKFEVLASLQTLFKYRDWDTSVNIDFKTYLLVSEIADIENLETKIRDITSRRMKNFLKENQYEIQANIILQSLKDVHLHSIGYQNESELRGSYVTVRFLFIIGCFVLILAWINFVNLSTARAMKRAREVGIRKTVGAGKKQLITQFLLEAFLINFISIVIAFSLYQIGYPFYIALVNKPIPIFNLLTNTSFLLIFIPILLFGILLSGGYSAFVLSSQKPASIIKGKFSSSKKGIVIRKSLIVIQFVISILIIACTFLVYKQLNFMKKYDLGFDRSLKLIIQAPYIIGENYYQQYQAFKNQSQKIPSIHKVTASHFIPGDIEIKGKHHIYKKGEPNRKLFVLLNCVDKDFFDAYKIKLLCGRTFNPEIPADKNSAVISRSLALQLGYEHPENALLGTIVIQPIWWGKEVNIIGIIDDMIVHSMREDPRGIMFVPAVPEVHMGYSGALRMNKFTVELSGNSIRLQDMITDLGAVFKKNFQGNPFEYHFLDDQFNMLYKAEEQYGKIFTTASALSVIIACMGLFGLSSFIIRQRIKEIGIRKVFGASSQNILFLLSGNYIKLIIISGIISFPIAYISLSRWLENYAYRVEIKEYLFLVPVGIVIIIALLTVGYQSLKATNINPAQVLQNE